MPDVCHNLHNACKDLCNIEEFKPVSSVSVLFKSDIILILQVVTKLRELLAFMSLSTFTLDHFDKARKDCKITQGLQSIGETRFALIYWSLQSVLDGFPAFIRIAQDTSNGIDSEVFI